MGGAGRQKAGICLFATTVTSAAVYHHRVNHLLSSYKNVPLTFLFNSIAHPVNHGARHIRFEMPCASATGTTCPPLPYRSIMSSQAMAGGAEQPSSRQRGLGMRAFQTKHAERVHPVRPRSCIISCFLLYFLVWNFWLRSCHGRRSSSQSFSLRQSFSNRPEQASAEPWEEATIVFTTRVAGWKKYSSIFLSS